MRATSEHRSWKIVAIPALTAVDDGKHMHMLMVWPCACGSSVAKCDPDYDGDRNASIYYCAACEARLEMAAIDVDPSPESLVSAIFAGWRLAVPNEGKGSKYEVFFRDGGFYVQTHCACGSTLSSGEYLPSLTHAFIECQTSTNQHLEQHLRRLGVSAS
jgi:hypothetical protein